MVIDCKKIAEQKLKSLKKEINKKKLQLKLDIIYIQKNTASKIYINNKKKAAEEIGVKVDIHTFGRNVSEDIIKATCNNLTFDSNCSGYFIQLPIASHLKKEKILEFISIEKDVDCLTSTNLGKILLGDDDCIKPAAVEAIISVLKSERIKLKSKVVTIVNDSNLIGKPLALYLLSKGATINICNKFTKDLSSFTKKADILVTATGNTNLIKANMVKDGVIIIDAGITKKGKKITGDVDFKSVSKKAKFITPVPGGVGPLTVTCLLENLLKIYKLKGNG